MGMEPIEPIDKPADKPTNKPAKPRKVKSTDKPIGKRSLNLSITSEVYERLAVHALADDRTISDIVSDLVVTHLRRVHLTRATKGVD
jgi:hypothetical protein